MAEYKVEGQVVAEVVVQAWGSLAGIQQGGSKEAVEASHSQLEAVQSLEDRKGNRACQAFSMSSIIHTHTHSIMKLSVSKKKKKKNINRVVLKQTIY